MLSFLISAKYHAIRWYKLNRQHHRRSAARRAIRTATFDHTCVATWTAIALIEASVAYGLFLIIC